MSRFFFFIIIFITFEQVSKLSDISSHVTTTQTPTEEEGSGGERHDGICFCDTLSVSQTVTDILPLCVFALADSFCGHFPLILD